MDQDHFVLGTVQTQDRKTVLAPKDHTPLILGPLCAGLFSWLAANCSKRETFDWGLAQYRTIPDLTPFLQSNPLP